MGSCLRRCEAMTLLCRPRAGGDPYAAAMSCSTAGDNRKLGVYGSPPARGRQRVVPCQGHLSTLDSRVRGNEWRGNASVLYVLIAFILALSTSAVWADDPFYRGKTISLIIGSNTSGGYDTYGRLLARHMGKHIAGHPAFVVQNMPGAGGLRSANHLYNVAATDGSVIGIFDQALFLDQLLGSGTLCGNAA